MAGSGLSRRWIMPSSTSRAGRLGQRRQLGEAGVGVGGTALGPHTDEHDALESQLAVLDLGDVGELGRQTGHAAQRGAVFERELTECWVCCGICHRQ